MDDKEIKKEIERIESYLFNSSNWKNIILTRKWAKDQPQNAGVYMLFEDDTPVYAGESGSISGRITDLLDSRHHTVRRSIGIKRFSTVKGFEKATTKKKFPSHIETLVNNQILKFKLCVLPLKFGRKEFEEYVVEKYDPEFNNKKKRKS